MEFHFLRPWWLLAMPALLLHAVFSVQRAAPGSAWEQWCDRRLLPHILLTPGTGGGRRRWYNGYLWTAGAMLAVLALAGPAWERQPQPLVPDEAALVIVLDLSPAMNARDLTPSRLVRARFKLDDIIAGRRVGETALVVYAGDAYVVSPLTDDVETIRSQLPSLETSIMPVAGSRLDLALEQAMDLFQGAGRATGHVLLVTSGSQDPQQDLSAVRKLRARGFHLSALGVGTSSGAPLPAASGFVKDSAGSIMISTLQREELMELTAAGDGLYMDMRNDSADALRLIEWFDRLRVTGTDNVCNEENAMCAEQKVELWHDRGPWLILPLLPLAALAFRRGGALETRSG